VKGRGHDLWQGTMSATPGHSKDIHKTPQSVWQIGMNEGTCWQFVSAHTFFSGN